MTAARNLIWQQSYGTTTVDAICEAAEVKKGSFYYFFQSKAELAVEALQTDWVIKKPGFDEIFTGPPLERLKKFFDFVYEGQSTIKRRYGRVLGCPIFSLGCEVSTLDRAICGVVQEILHQYEVYFETAIRDAHAAGLLNAPDARAMAQRVVSYFEGALTQARIQNAVEPLKDLYPAALQIIGAHTAQAA